MGVVMRRSTRSSDLVGNPHSRDIRRVRKSWIGDEASAPVIDLRHDPPEPDLQPSVVSGFERFPEPTRPALTRSVPDALATRVPALDGLRGLAAAAVVVFHLGFVSGGWLAVDLFFTLSGFLITTLLLREWHRDDRIGLAAFWGRRARRLLPALAICLALVGVLTVVAGETAAALHRQAWSTALYVSNWTAVFSPTSYWELFTQRSPLEHTWSLAIEEQFYLVWPLLCAVVLWLGRGRVKALAGATAALLLASLAAMWFLYTPGDDTNRVYFGTDTRAASILIGALLACWLTSRPHHASATGERWSDLPSTRLAGRVALEAAAIVAALGLVLAWLFVEGTTVGVYRGGLALHAVAAATLIAAAVHPVRGVVHRALAVRPLVFLGLISYGVYLYHWPVIWWLTPERTGLSPIPLALVQATVTLGLAIGSWYLVEKRVLQGALRFPKLLPVIAVVAAVSVALVIVTPVQSQPGNLAMAAADTGKVEFDLPPPPATPVGAPGVVFPPVQPAYRVLFAGDSVPYSIAKNWEPPADQVSIGNLAIPSCDGARGGRIRFPLNLYVDDKPECQSWSTIWPDALALFKPDAMYLMLGMAALQDRQVNGVYTRPCEARFDNWYAGEVDYRLTFLEQRTTVPILLTISPYADDRAIGILPANHRRRTDCLNAIYRAIGERHAGVQLVDLAGWLCPEGHCRTEIEGQPYRPDGLHFSPPAAKEVGTRLVEQGQLAGLARIQAAAAAPPASDAAAPGAPPPLPPGGVAPPA